MIVLNAVLMAAHSRRHRRIFDVGHLHAAPGRWLRRCAHRRRLQVNVRLVTLDRPQALSGSGVNDRRASPGRDHRHSPAVTDPAVAPAEDAAPVAGDIRAVGSAGSGASTRWIVTPCCFRSDAATCRPAADDRFAPGATSRTGRFSWRQRDHTSRDDDPRNSGRSAARLAASPSPSAARSPARAGASRRSLSRGSPQPPTASPPPKLDPRTTLATRRPRSRKPS